MTPTNPIVAQSVVAVLSMLHEPLTGANSVTRRFRGEAPLSWTLFRLRQSKQISKFAVLCWQEQLQSVTSLAAEMEARCFAFSPRAPIERVDAISASRRWADGWRGGLLAACDFDRGFHGPWMLQILNEFAAENLLIVDPAAALVDPSLTDQLITHAAANKEAELCFSQAAPGICGVLLKKSMLQQLASTSSCPGILLGYRPDLPQRDPISTPACMPVAATLARTTMRLTLDSQRQIDRISRGTVHLNGQLRSTEAEQLVHELSLTPVDYTLPREIVLELTLRRNTKPTFLPAGHLKIERPDIDLAMAKTIIDEFAVADDARLMLTGVGDPLLHEKIFDIIEYAHSKNIAVALETDLIGVDETTLDKLAAAPLDVVSVHLPAATLTTYQSLMGVDGFTKVLDNIRGLVVRKQARRSGTPLIVPTLVKTAANLGEMEPWYDHWMRVLGCAVISGPSDFAAQIPDLSITNMTPPGRKPCARITSRMTILSDGSIVSCEQDVQARHVMGHIGHDSITSVWQGKAASLRSDHASAQWLKRPNCATCKDWHRP
jgi:spiro-SPASM protein